MLALLSAGILTSCLKKLDVPSLDGLVLASAREASGGPVFRTPFKTYQTTCWSASGAADYAAMNAMNSGAGYANRTDWSLPMAEALGSLIHYWVANPATFDSAFPNTGVSFYWTSDNYVPTASSAWRIRFDDGVVNGASNAGTNNVRCVANSPATVQAFADNGDGTILYAVTGLLWQKCSMGTLTDATCSGSATALRLMRTWSCA